MTLITIMLPYFQGEKIEALVFILPIGLLSLVFGAWLVTEGESFAKGVALPFILMGLVMSVVGGVVGFRTLAQVQTLELDSPRNPRQQRQQGFRGWKRSIMHGRNISSSGSCSE